MSHSHCLRRTSPCITLPCERFHDFHVASSSWLSAAWPALISPCARACEGVVTDIECEHDHGVEFLLQHCAMQPAADACDEGGQVAFEQRVGLYHADTALERAPFGLRDQMAVAHRGAWHPGADLLVGLVIVRSEPERLDLLEQLNQCAARYHVVLACFHLVLPVRDHA